MSSFGLRIIVWTDNEPLARWLVENFVAKFSAFQGVTTLGNLVYRKLDSVETSGDPSNIYSRVA